MQEERYMVLEDANHTCSEIIVSKTTDIKLKVFPLKSMEFTPDPNQIHLYVKCRDEVFAFETINLSVKKGIDICTAVKWYARQYLDSTDMIITV